MESPIASRFYTFSSLNRLGFSASSHYLFVGKYPLVWPADDGQYGVGDEVCSLREAVAKIESSLAASPIEPFFGSATDYDVRLITESLARQGSALQPDLIRHGASASIWLIAGPRRCRVSATSVECFDRQKELCVICANVDDVVALARRFLENGVTAGELAGRSASSQAMCWIGSITRRLHENRHPRSHAADRAPALSAPRHRYAVRGTGSEPALTHARARRATHD